MPQQLLSQIKIGHRQILMGANDVGFTEEGSKLIIKGDGVERVVAEYGSSPFDIYLKGWEIAIELIVKESTLDMIAAAIGGTIVGASVDKVDLNVAPRSASTAVWKLKIPGSVNDDLTWTIWKGAIIPDVEPVFNNEEDQMFKIRVQALLDQDATSKKCRMVRYGDPAEEPLYY